MQSIERDGEKTVKYKNKEHTVRFVISLFSYGAKIDVPPMWIQDSSFFSKMDSWKFSAADLFVGYLMLDAWISNTDRHNENWAVIVSEGRFYLAPTFDHASSLGRIESEDTKLRKLESRDARDSVSAYANKAKSALYRTNTSPKPLLTIDAFAEACVMRPRAAREWGERLRQVPADLVTRAVGLVPESIMSNISKKFAIEILTHNRSRVLEVLERLK